VEALRAEGVYFFEDFELGLTDADHVWNLRGVHGIKCDWFGTSVSTIHHIGRKRRGGTRCISPSLRK
jgi:hypothetical protein